MGQRQNGDMDQLTAHLMDCFENGFWDQIRSEAQREAECEPMLISFLFASV
jgi:hypothetical protein